MCDAHQGIVPAVATINLSGSGAPMTISVCAHHLAVFEEQFGGWGGAQ